MRCRISSSRAWAVATKAALRPAAPFSHWRYDYESVQGNSATALQIAEKFAGNGPKAVVAIGTPAAQALANTLNGSVPLVFVVVTDSVAAKLVMIEIGRASCRERV